MVIIDLCCFDPFCTRDATHAVTLSFEGRTASPIKVCGFHLEECRQRAGRDGVTMHGAELPPGETREHADERRATGPVDR